MTSDNHQPLPVPKRPLAACSNDMAVVQQPLPPVGTSWDATMSFADAQATTSASTTPLPIPTRQRILDGLPNPQADPQLSTSLGTSSSPISRIPIATTRTGTLKSTTTSPGSSATAILPPGSLTATPSLQRKRSKTVASSSKTSARRPPDASTPATPEFLSSPPTDSGRPSLDSQYRRARTKSTPLQSSSPDVSSNRLSVHNPGSTKIPLPTSRSPRKTQSGFSPDSTPNGSEPYRFPTPSPDLPQASRTASRVASDDDGDLNLITNSFFPSGNPSSESLDPDDLQFNMSRSLSANVPLTDLGAVLTADKPITAEPAPFIVDRTSLMSGDVAEWGGISRDSPVGPLGEGILNDPDAAVETGPSLTPEGLHDTGLPRRRAESMAPTTSAKRSSMIAKGRDAQLRQVESTSSNSTPIKKSSPSTRRVGTNESPTLRTPTSSTRTSASKTTPVARRRSRGPASNLSPSPSNDLSKMPTSTSSSGLSDFPEAFLVPYIPPSNLPKGVRPDEAPIPAVERRLMRERLAKEGLGEDELVTVWGPDGSPLIVSKASIAEGLPAGVTEIQPSNLASQTKDASDRPHGTSSNQLASASDSQVHSGQAGSIDRLAPQPLTRDRSRKPSLTFAHSSYVNPSSGPESPAPFQSDRFIPLDSAALSLAPPEEGMKRKPSLLRKASSSRRQRSQQSIRDRENESNKVSATIQLDHLRTNTNERSASGWDPSVLSGRSDGPANPTKPITTNTNITTRPKPRELDGEHGKKGGCKCLIM